jgi:nucleoid-associated protein YgaU
MSSPPAAPRRARAVVTLIAAIAAGVALASTRQDLGVADGTAPAEATVVAVAQWALWLVAGYVVAVMTAASALAVFGHVGRPEVVFRVVPVMWRPVLGALLGMTLTATPAAAASPPPTPAAAGPIVTADPFDWSAPLDAIRGIDAAANRVAAATTVSTARRAPPGDAAGRTVRVRAGDCLWSVAARDLVARHLGSRPVDIAAAWRQWYAANHATIGANPRLLRPGEILRAPPALASPPNPSRHIARRHP